MESEMESVRIALVKRAADFLVKTDGTAQVGLRLAWLKEEKRLTDTEVTEAMNMASGGELVRAALGPADD